MITVVFFVIGYNLSYQFIVHDFVVEGNVIFEFQVQLFLFRNYLIRGY